MGNGCVPFTQDFCEVNTRLWFSHFSILDWQIFKTDFNDQQEAANFLFGQERTVKTEQSREKSKWRNILSFYKS